MFTPLQKQAVKNNLSYLPKYITPELTDKLNDMLEKNVNEVDCNYIVSLIYKLHEDLGFNERIYTANDLQKVIKKYDSAPKS